MPLDRAVLAVTPPGAGVGGRGAVSVLRALGLGDLLTAVPALRALAEALPRRRLILATPASLAPLVALMGPVARRIELVDARGLDDVPAGLRGVRTGVNLHGSGPESHRLLVAAGVRRLTAFRHASVPESAEGPEWHAGEHEVERWCRLLGAAGIDADPRRLHLEPPGAAAGHPLRGVTVVHPGATRAARRWPAERFAAVARAERAAGRHVVVTGGPEEALLARRVAAVAGLPDSAVLAGRTDVGAMAALVAAAGRVVCGDTGVAHLATALGTPSVLVFGPTSPRAWGPPAALRDRHRVVWAGRTGDPHGRTPHEGLLRIASERVIEELAGLG
ncbi:MAG: glycosyl transferase, family 9 [Solirubrobacterales bacterium]|nr:glycosyl transferase, family 9 [Solirubrobacterales bacterium]